MLAIPRLARLHVMAKLFARLAVVTAFLAASNIARAERPVLAGGGSFGITGGDVLVHYATTGVDAVPMTDANADGVPDFVAEVANTAELALARYASLGFRRPLDDGVLGGDGRIDIYLRDLSAADGNAGTDECTAGKCVGFAVAENDYVGFTYPSVTEGIRSVVPHELFHLAQYAYAMDQSATWTEGTAVWAVEQLFGDQNGDFERFLPGFLTRTFRPFERSVGGFGDSYPYGAALWPYFLEHRFGVDTIVAAWTGCEQSAFLDATRDALLTRGSSIDAAWIEFTRWNAFTGPRATSSGYPDALGWSEAPREPAIAASGTIYVEGFSARYVPVVLAERSRVEVVPTGGIRIAAWLVADGRGLDDGIELSSDGSAVVATTDAGTYTLVVTGLSRGTITTAVEVVIAEPRSDDGGGCSAAPTTCVTTMLLVAFVLPWRRSRRCRNVADRWRPR
jgi:hypothetical protein